MRKAINPAIIKAIITIGKAIIDKNAKRQQELRQQQQEEWLKEILYEIREIKRILNQIVGTLEEIKVRIDQNWEDFFNNKLISSLQIIEANNDFWRRENDTHLNDKDTQEQINLEFSKLQDSARTSMNSGAYGNYDSIMLAFRTELYLVGLLGREKYVTSNITKQYLDFLYDCVDPTVNGSIANTKELVLSETEKLANKFKAGDSIYFGKEVASIRNGDDDCDKVLRKYFIVQGSIYEGFKFNREDVETIENCRVHRYPEGRQNKKLAEVAVNVSIPIVTSKRRDTRGEYNSAHNYFLHNLKPKIEVLEACENQIREYMENLIPLMSE